MNVLENVPLAPLTTMGLGGPARYFFEASAQADLIQALHWARGKGLPCFLLGGGSNVVFRDEGFAGLVLKIGLKGMHQSDADGGRVRITVAAGEIWDDFVRHCVDEGLAGIEAMSGIPGQVGSVPVQNVGAYGQEVSSVIESVDCLDLDTLTAYRLDQGGCQFAYRSSVFKERDHRPAVIVAVTFLLQSATAARPLYRELQARLGEEAPLKRIREEVLALRAAKGMLVGSDFPRSCGSFFLNPIVPQEQAVKLQGLWPTLPVFAAAQGQRKLSAAFLIEKCGMAKGFRLSADRTAGVSPHHTLALTSSGQSAADLIELAEHIERTVKEKTGIQLEREPIFV